MNPGYAGRTELPDNLKVPYSSSHAFFPLSFRSRWCRPPTVQALFRPVAMMIPDYALIGEIMLFSEGFNNARSLAQKMVRLFKLASEQLSKQDHYDFGMRAVKSILVMAGSLKRREPDLEEDIVLIRAMRDANVPKFLADDVVLFMALIQDLFPGIHIPDADYGALELRIHRAIDSFNVEHVPTFVEKVVQLYETMVVRHGVMLVGQTGTGKTMCYKVLQHALTAMDKDGVDPNNDYYAKVHTSQLNPKSVKMGELYGELNELTAEWRDGLIAALARAAVDNTTRERNWIVFDGPVDAIWIENMNTVLDDNKMLCLPNGERIKLPPTVSMMFEVQDLAVASPATVSRCGMVYMDDGVLDGGWLPQLRTWVRRATDAENGELPPVMRTPQMAEYLSAILPPLLESSLNFVYGSCRQPIDGGRLNLVDSCLRLLSSLISRGVDTERPDPSMVRETEKAAPAAAAPAEEVSWCLFIQLSCLSFSLAICLDISGCYHPRRRRRP